MAEPSGVPSSSAMRSATVRAAIRRGCVWPMSPRTPRPSSRQIFGLRGLARAGLARDDHDLGVADRGEDVVLAPADRQHLGIGDVGYGGPPLRDAELSRLDGGGELCQLPLARLRLADPARAVEPPGQALLVAQRQAIEPLLEGRGGRERSRHVGFRVGAAVAPPAIDHVWSLEGNEARCARRASLPYACQRWSTAGDGCRVSRGPPARLRRSRAPAGSVRSSARRPRGLRRPSGRTASPTRR